MTLAGTFFEHFSNIKDPRIHNHNFRHNIFDMIVITVLATICGADGWAEIERFGQDKEEWLKTFLELPNGIPSHDTFGRLFAILEPREFEKCFSSWLKSLRVDLKVSDNFYPPFHRTPNLVTLPLTLNFEGQKNGINRNIYPWQSH